MFIYFLSFKLKLVSIRLLLHLKCILCKIITNCHRLSPSNWTRKARIPYNKNIQRLICSLYILYRKYFITHEEECKHSCLLLYIIFCKLHTIIGNNKLMIVKAFSHRNTNIFLLSIDTYEGVLKHLTYYIHCSAWLILKYIFRGLKFENVILRESDI